jgi:signal peptidase I
VLKILRVRGDSLEPAVHHGDFLLLAAFPGWHKKLRLGDLVVFEQPGYGILVKRVERIDAARKEVVVTGNALESVDSRTFGSVPFGVLRGRVVRHFRRS